MKLEELAFIMWLKNKGNGTSAGDISLTLDGTDVYAAGTTVLIEEEETI